MVGKVINYRNQIQFHHPELHEETEATAETDELIPVYSETEGLTSKKLRATIKAAFDAMEYKLGQKDDPFETLPAWVRKKYDLAPRGESLYKLHFPDIKEAAALLERKTPYHTRIIFDEFFLLELILASRKKGLSDQKAPAITLNTEWEERFRQSLPFELTNAQNRVLKDIKADIAKTSPMNRLVQGDVGSGKTVVALIAALHTVSSGMQVAFMAPTEILAQQHFKHAKRFLEPLNITVELLVGNMKSAEKQSTLSAIHEGKIHVVVGTHAHSRDGALSKA